MNKIFSKGSRTTPKKIKHIWVKGRATHKTIKNYRPFLKAYIFIPFFAVIHRGITS
tara:strand:+ start:472 stop:639 length:168 start_codon:yes stop_codon:yes gene_type:complete